MTPYLTDVVSSADLDCELDLEDMAYRSLNANYNEKLDVVVMTIRGPIVAYFYENGMMVWTGCKTVERSRKAGRKFARIAQLLGFNARFTKFNVVNLVARYDVDFKIQLERFAVSRFGQLCVYEPEAYPCLVYKNQSVNILIFASGKMVFSGALKEKQVYDAFVNIIPIVQEFRSGQNC